MPMTGWNAVAGKQCQVCGDPATHYYGDMLICCSCHVGEKDAGLFTREQAEREHARVLGGREQAEEWDAGPEPSEPPGGFKCCVCHENWVDALNGFDTCAECLKKA